jgi:hypothetical protein
MSEQAFLDLKNDIAENGLREPIILHDGMVLDGGNRYRACLDAGEPPFFEEYTGDDIAAYVLSANLHRRHLTTSQHAAIVASVQNWVSASRHGGNRETQGKSDGSGVGLKTAADRAAASGASINTQRKADAVAKADPSLIKKVASGEVSLEKAVKLVAPQLSPGKRIIHDEPHKDDHSSHELDEARETIKALAEENEEIRTRLMVLNEGDDSEDVIREFSELRAQIKALNLEVYTLKGRRDQLMGENCELKKQVAWYKAKLAQAEKKGA